MGLGLFKVRVRGDYFLRIDFSHGNGQENEQKSSPQASVKKLVSAFWVGLFIGMIAFLNLKKTSDNSLYCSHIDSYLWNCL